MCAKGNTHTQTIHTYIHKERERERVKLKRIIKIEHANCNKICKERNGGRWKRKMEEDEDGGGGGFKGMIVKKRGKEYWGKSEILKKQNVREFSQENEK